MRFILAAIELTGEIDCAQIICLVHIVLEAVFGDWQDCDFLRTGKLWRAAVVVFGLSSSLWMQRSVYVASPAALLAAGNDQHGRMSERCVV